MQNTLLVFLHTMVFKEYEQSARLGIKVPEALHILMPPLHEVIIDGKTLTIYHEYTQIHLGEKRGMFEY